MVGSEESLSLSLSLSGSGGSRDADPNPNPNPDPFAMFAVDFTIPPLEDLSKSATPTTTATTAKSMGMLRREDGWRNLEDYEYL